MRSASVTAMAAPVAMLRRVHHGWRHRGNPSALRALDRVLEGFVGAALLHGMGLVGLLLPGIREGLLGLPVGLLVVGSIWCALNAGVGAWVTVMVFASRWRCRVHWSMIDFVEKHSPAHGREPRTEKERQAQQLEISI